MKPTPDVLTVHIILVNAGFEGLALQSDPERGTLRVTCAPRPVPQEAAEALEVAGFSVARVGKRLDVTMPEASR